MFRLVFFEEPDDDDGGPSWRRRISALLERAAQGEEIVITRHGRTVARLVPAAVTEEGRIGWSRAALKSFR